MRRSKGDDVPLSPISERPIPTPFRKDETYPNLFEFNLDRLDVNLKVYPAASVDADRDAVLLFVFGCEQILGLETVNEAYICRKLRAARDESPGPDRLSFEAAYAWAARFDVQDVVNDCVAGGDLERVTYAAGGEVRLTDYARRTAAAMAFAMNQSS